MRTSKSLPDAATFEQPSSKALDALEQFVTDHAPVFLLTGAGCSTHSGLSDYRNKLGEWKRPPPMTAQEFTHNLGMRKRYWARSYVGWKHFSTARPNITHHVIAALHNSGLLRCTVTQNVDGLHTRAGQQQVIDLHGRLDQIRCLSCKETMSRELFQIQLQALNPELDALDACAAPDGDADLEPRSFDWLKVPGCENCGGVLKPDVVFFGENVAAEVVNLAMDELHRANGMLVIGSSLMVFSGYRFVRAAASFNLPTGAINLGVTRADDLITVKWNLDCCVALEALAKRLDLTLNA